MSAARLEARMESLSPFLQGSHPQQHAGCSENISGGWSIF
jgi:hypothetical protein